MCPCSPSPSVSTTLSWIPQRASGGNPTRKEATAAREDRRAPVDDQVITPSIWPTPMGRNWEDGSAKASAIFRSTGCWGPARIANIFDFCNLRFVTLRLLVLLVAKRCLPPKFGLRRAHGSCRALASRTPALRASAPNSGSSLRIARNFKNDACHDCSFLKPNRYPKLASCAGIGLLVWQRTEAEGTG
jgi:hypothetical protein